MCLYVLVWFEMLLVLVGLETGAVCMSNLLGIVIFSKNGKAKKYKLVWAIEYGYQYIVVFFFFFNYVLFGNNCAYFE